MARIGPGSTAGARGGRGARRPPTWEISDSDTEDAAGARREGTEARRPPTKEISDTKGARREGAGARRPGADLKQLTVCVDPALLEDSGADLLLEALGALGCKVLLEPQRPAHSVRWSPRDPAPCARGAQGAGSAVDVPEVPPEARAVDQQDEHVMLLLEPAEFLRGVEQLTQTCGPPCPVPWLLPKSPACPHLAVIGLDVHLRSRQPSAGTWLPARPSVGQAQVEEARALLQLWAGLDVLLVSSWRELAQHVSALTRALAQRPLKQRRDQAFSFCTAGRWAAGEPVTRAGAGLRAAWRRQVTQLNRVSPDVAATIVAAFPSPRLLQQAYAACSSEQERLALLADLPVTVGQDTRPRRVGPDISRRICLLLTTTNPDLLLDLGS